MATRKTKAAEMDIDEKWRVESDLSTLLAAKEIEKDPKRMAAVRKCAKEKAAVLNALKA